MRKLQDTQDPQAPPEPQEPTGYPDEKEALKKVVKRKFTVNPATVLPFNETEVSWDVTVPADSPFDVSVKLDEEMVGPVGSKKFSLIQSKEFMLTAATEHEGKFLGRVRVQVDSQECRTKTWLEATIRDIIKTNTDNHFMDNDRLKLRDHGTQVTLRDSLILIRIPLHIPENFDAGIDIDIQLEVRGGLKVKVRAKSVNLEGSAGLVQHIASLGLTALVELGLERLDKSVLLQFVSDKMAAPLEEVFTSQIARFLGEMKDEDSQTPKRDYNPASVRLTPEGLNITGCPTPT